MPIDPDELTLASPAALGATTSEQQHDPRENLPPLFRDRAFWGMTATQFLGAFNDNLFKQLMLLLAIPVGAAVATKQDEQGLASMIFALPFVLLSGFAGYLSDRYSKRTIIVLAKVAEIGIMLLGMAAFWSYGTTGYQGLLIVLFLMGVHSAFFGPGKYGILPELFRASDLPRANGVILMTTFLAIIFGTASAGVLGVLLSDVNGQRDPQRLWLGSAICMGIAGVGALTSLLVRKTRPAAPNLRFELETIGIPAETRRLLQSDRPLLAALVVSSVFWMVSGVAILAVNSLGMAQLGLNEAYTSAMTAVIGLGIAVGAVLAGKLSAGKADFRIVRLGGWGIVVALGLLSLSYPHAGGYRHVLGFGGSLPVLVLLGVSAGMFAIPVQVFLQTRPPDAQKGRMIAAMNLTNFIAILAASGIYTGFDRLVTAFELPRSVIFALCVLLILPVMIFYRPREE